ncbi:hypothetical protein A1OE_1085 [Candidatus Endolissoclinum faulkneri L2]|uniref:Uncharacterized protein n=1 Tax=Candidatus Endolissoclinum faulkneri L2 TaxID=1193729 RepID=K7Z5D6_9PROT|nr:hypothetical protein A1OE_1085 [Candidatus Endolissoclinum faulkneri L2]
MIIFNKLSLRVALIRIIILMQKKIPNDTIINYRLAILFYIDQVLNTLTSITMQNFRSSEY